MVNFFEPNTFVTAVHPSSAVYNFFDPNAYVTTNPGTKKPKSEYDEFVSIWENILELTLTGI